ncbi:hypothetical protein [Candidatus Allofournierella merdipullorum]|uniref:hypothetical protein n=1 Tax=Candidatus Allofournierella merdipullorum TaxID=2838595 RepID=UPI003AB2D0FB
MSDITLERLQVEVEAPTTQAEKSISSLADTLGKLKNATKNLGLNGVAKQVSTLNTSLNGVSSDNAEKLNKLAQSLQTLSQCGKLKLSPSVATQIASIGNAAQSLNGMDFSALNALSSALTPLSNVGKANLNSFISQLTRLPQAVQALNSVDIGGMSSKISQLVSALTPLTQMGKNNLTSFVTQLQKLPQVMSALQSVNMTTLASQIQQLANALAPLATQMQSIANGFSAFPARIQRLIASTNSLSYANNKASLSYVNLAAKIGIAVMAMKRIGSAIAGWITKSNEYVESLNLFTVSLGEYAAEAQKYAENVAEIMGIDPAEWLRNQGVFMTLATGFGVVNDRAYTMSKNLTQLGYDLSSFFNISYEDAFQKLQSGISGELEPLRRLGYDLSVARLQQEALNLGITKSVNAMTQAEKAELRYYAIMTQVTTAQGDMARTLEAPANQLRILQAQVNQAARALGNIFIPMLNAVLPYAIALAKAIRLVADAIASLFGFALPEIDYSGLSTAAGGAGDLADNLGDAGKKAKEVKNALLGIDELNIISPQDDSSSGSGSGIGGGGGLGFELPTYDFIGNAVSDKVEEILGKMKEWLGLTEEINSWSDFFHTRLGRILTTVGAISLGLAAWKISRGVISALETIRTLQKAGLGNALTLSIGISLTIGGIALEAAGIIDAIQNELNGMNFAQIVGGGLLGTSGLAFLGSSIATWIDTAFGSSAVSLAITQAGINLGVGTAGAAGAALAAGVGGIILGIPAMITGIYDSIKNGIDWLSAALTAIGSTAAGAGIGVICAAAGTAITPGIGTLIGLAVGLVADGIILVVQKWDEITAFVKKFFTQTIPGIWNKFTGWFSKQWESFKNFDWYGLGYELGQSLGNAWKSAVDFVTVRIPNWFSKMWNSIKSAFTKFFTVTLPNFFTQTIPNVVTKIGEFFKALPGKIEAAVKSGWKKFTEIGSSIIDGIWEGLQTIWTKITDFVDGFVQGFKDALGIHSPSTVFATIGEDIVAGLLKGIEGFTNMLSTVSEWASKVVEFFTKGADGRGIVENFKEIGGNIVSGFKDKIGNTYTTVKTNVTTWASGVKEWFSNTSFGGINSTTFQSYATNIVDGFKNRVANYYTAAKSAMTTFGSNVKSWFTDYVSYDKFYSIASDVVQGFKNGIGALYNTCKNTISSWGASIISWFKEKLDSNSPSKVFERIGEDTILGYNIGITSLGKTTKGVVSSWADSFTSVSPVMSFAVDTSALKYYNGNSFAKAVTANVSANSNFSIDTSHVREEFREAVLEALNESRLAEDMRRQADKKEQTIVQVGNRTITDVVTTQQRANGYRFATT